MKKMVIKALLFFDLWSIIVASIVFPLLYNLDGSINMMALVIVIASLVSLNVITLIAFSIKKPKQIRISKKEKLK